MFKTIPKKFDNRQVEIMGKQIKVITNCCNRTEMSCCGGGGGGGCCMSMFLHLTNVCNSSCSFCIADKNKSEISNFKKLESTISELVQKQVISKIVLTGGEPLLHSNFPYFLKMLDKVDLMWYSLNTNGTLLNKYIYQINDSKLKHINISIHHHDDKINKSIMGKCCTWEEIGNLNNSFNKNIEVRAACTISKELNTESEIMKYIETAKAHGLNNVIFRNEYRGFDKNLSSFKKIWEKLYTADICNCGYKLINGINAEFRQSNIKLKQAISEANTYFRDFIYKDDDMLSGSWEYGFQNIG